MTKTVNVGGLQLGGGHPVLVQSMTNTDTRDAEATLAQIRALHDAGCDIVRVSVYDEACAEAVKILTEKSPLPLVADIHLTISWRSVPRRTVFRNCGSTPATSAEKPGSGNWRTARKLTGFR